MDDYTKKKKTRTAARHNSKVMAYVFNKDIDKYEWKVIALGEAEDNDIMYIHWQGIQFINPEYL